ncbi:hypothetical protein FH966_10300 [Lentibacillus cibarius]|uniref:Peptidase C45 hydrolase domain-containing protein n=1 Tax=Lentibacillus cibarius TaxID=2583219 RepID=A0A549YJJ7_9BACI|nr:C45 family peptidase [Lentibacillus cibarius]RYG72453.1 hypothetical protein EU245_10200 [Lentibacillus lipolyticus]TRM12041.1 hypothetical protein FH966_10300 [Lentibacillus cibarius]
MKALYLSGTAFDIGKQHGTQAKEEVHHSLDSYERLFWYEANMKWKHAIELGKLHLDYIEKTNIALLDEMEGIAKGASVSFHDILALNARSEIALTNNKSDGCTSVALMPTIAESAFLGQTWDWRASQSKSLIFTNIKQNDAPEINMVTEGGIIGKIGLNAYGLGVCLNALRANMKSNKLPVHLGLREILNSIDLNEALEKIRDQKIASSANFLIAQGDKSGAKATNVEISPVGEDRKTTRDNFLYHTNHFYSARLVDQIGKEKLNTTENTFYRASRIKKLINNTINDKKIITTDIIRQWFSDHEHYPNSICRHMEEDSSEYTSTVTAFSIIMDLNKHNLYLMEGQACNPSEIANFHFN